MCRHMRSTRGCTLIDDVLHTIAHSLQAVPAAETQTDMISSMLRTALTFIFESEVSVVAPKGNSMEKITKWANLRKWIKDLWAM